MNRMIISIISMIIAMCRAKLNSVSVLPFFFCFVGPLFGSLDLVYFLCMYERFFGLWGLLHFMTFGYAWLLSEGRFAV